MKSFQEIGIDLNGKKGTQVRTLCPQCSHTRKKSNDPCLAVNTEEGVFNCFNCGWNGNVKGSRNNPSFIPKQKKTTTPFEPSELSELETAHLNFFEKRGIKRETLIAEGIKSCKKYLPQVQGYRNCIAFPFFKNNRRVATKYRDSEKNMTQDKGGEKCFYRFDEMSKGSKIYITEGEIDALTLIQCGFSDGVVSVPDGAPNPTANNLDNKFSYFTEEAMEIFDKAEQVYLVVDNDRNGRFLENELKRRIGIDKCLKVEYPDACKDINDVLNVFGEDAVKNVIENATHYPISGLKSFKDYFNDIYCLQKGVTGDYWETGWEHMNRHLKIKTGQLNIVTGSPGSGKSEWLDAMMINTIQQYGVRWAVFSPENYPPQVYFKKLSEKFTGRDFNMLSDNELGQTIVDLSDKIDLIVDNDEDEVSIDYLFERIRALVFRHGVKAVIIDPWNEIEHQIGQREDLYLNKVLRKIKRFIRKYDISFWLVAHPKNPTRKQDGTYNKITAFDIAGGYAWFAKADNIFSIWRDKQDFKKPVEVEIQKIKQKTDGQLGTVKFFYDFDNGRYKSVASSLDEDQVCESAGSKTVNGLPSFVDDGKF